MNNKLYESIMKDISKIIKNSINEESGNFFNDDIFKPNDINQDI
jgi:hypothetical protein